MGHFVAQAPLEGADESFATVVGEIDTAGGLHEIGGPNLTIADGLEDNRIGDQGPERLSGRGSRRIGVGEHGVDRGRREAAEPSIQSRP